MSRIGLNGIEPPLLAVCVVVWNDPSGVNSSAYTANQTINWNKSIVNRYNMWVPSRPNRITIPVDGYYKVGATVRMASTHTDYNDWNMMLNSDTVSATAGNIASVLRACHGQGAYACTSAATIVKLKSGDFLTVGLERNFALYSDNSRFFVYEIRGMPVSQGSLFVK